MNRYFESGEITGSLVIDLKPSPTFLPTREMNPESSFTTCNPKFKRQFESELLPLPVLPKKRILGLLLFGAIVFTTWFWVDLKTSPNEANQQPHAGATFAFGKKTASSETSHPPHAGATFTFGKNVPSQANEHPSKQFDLPHISPLSQANKTTSARPAFSIHNESFSEKPDRNFQKKTQPISRSVKGSESKDNSSKGGDDDEISNEVIEISRSLLDLTEIKAREIALSMIESERQQQQQLPYMQPQPPQFPNQFMLMKQQQQQQQQLYRMIQMTNEMQAQN